MNFSGSKGYHIHVSSENVKSLGRDERREIVDYLTGKINFKDYLRFSGGKEEEVMGPKKETPAGLEGYTGVCMISSITQQTKT